MKREIAVIPQWKVVLFLSEILIYSFRQIKLEFAERRSALAHTPQALGHIVPDPSAQLPEARRSQAISGVARAARKTDAPAMAAERADSLIRGPRPIR